MSSLFDVTVADKWRQSTNGQTATNFVAIAPNIFAYSAPSGDPLDTVHDFFPNTVITRSIPSYPPLPSPSITTSTLAYATATTSSYVFTWTASTGATYYEYSIFNVTTGLTIISGTTTGLTISGVGSVINSGDQCSFNVTAKSAKETSLLVTALVTAPGFNPATLGALMTWFDASAPSFNLGTNQWSNLGSIGGFATLSGVTSTTINGKTAAVFTTSAKGTFTWRFATGSRGFFGVWKTDVNLTTSGQGSYILSEQNNSFYFTIAHLWNGIGNAALATISFNQQLEIGANQNPPKTNLLTAYGLSQDAAGPSSLNNYVTFQGVPQTLVWNNASTGFTDIGNNVTCYINGGAPAPASTIGMTLCEILVYDAALTPATATTVTNYLKSKWGIP